MVTDMKEMAQQGDQGIPSSISVVIPAFNEKARIVPTINRIADYLSGHFRESEIIVVDDGSDDGTADIVQSAAFHHTAMRLFRNGTNMGKGSSIKKGVAASSKELVLLTDADLSTPIEEVGRLLQWITRGCDIVIGSRGLEDSDVALRQPWYREGMGRIFNLIVCTLVLGGFKDTQCGFKLFRVDAAKEIFSKSMIRGFSYDVEILFIAQKMGKRIREVPVRWFNSPHSRVRIFRDSFRMFVDLLVIRLNWIMGKYSR